MTDGGTAQVQNNNISSNPSYDENSNNNNNNNDSNNKERVRSKTASPADDIFSHLNTNSSSSDRSLLNDDSLIGSSDLISDDTFYSLQLDIDIGTDATLETDITGDLGFQEEDNDFYNDDDWFSSPYSLYSPTNACPTQPSKQRKSLIRTAFLSTHNHQVFQHVVDPIDIKSSPTLAQLNLNSSDDPTDSLWGDTSTGAMSNSTSISSTTTSSMAHQASNSDLLSNCTSIDGTTSNYTTNNLATCNHLNHLHNHHHHQQAQTYHHMIPQSAHLNSGNLPSSCHHFHHHHHTNDQNRFCSTQNQSTCLAVTPFKRDATEHSQRLHNHQQHCYNHHSDYRADGSNALHQQQFNCHNLKHPSTISQQNQLHYFTGDLSKPQQQTTGDDKHNQEQKQLSSQTARCSSPVLVTSSSSPLSSNNQSFTNSCDNRLIDSKLKENIEYLTALLCNGKNKLENTSNTQQQTISSTMVKSYATLAHSLSTGPKFLERQSDTTSNHHQSLNLINPSNSQQNTAAVPSICGAHHINGVGTNEAVSHHINGIQDNVLKRPYPDYWYKPTVESSVSAADSTAEQVQTASCGGIVHMNGAMSNCAYADGNGHHHHPHQMVIPSENGQTVPNQPDMKVLSNLLNTNTCPGQACTNMTAPSVGHAGIVPNWHTNQQILMNTTHVYEANQQSHNTVPKQDSSPIPQNGRPITLKPIANNNGIIVQQQQKALPKKQPAKTKASLFVQPASPSASSTASSGGNNEIGSTSSNSVAAKRPRTANNQQTSKQKSDRPTRPSSMSTDCSISSHDEGFSSQVDNDDCGSIRDSDDDDDVDSDDESFYGDYTNNDIIGASISDNAECKWTLNMGRTRRNGQKRFFWQYNVQSKGPKGARICSADNSEDPFVLPEASDPVFSNDCKIEGVKHSGKARRGDGNDLTPNPRKLLMIGLELKKLGKIINDLVPVTDLPINARNKTRKEKNKLASRACRLKKKAQHEANKIKLYGLQREHQQIVMAIFDVRKLLSETLAQQEAELLKQLNVPQSLGGHLISNIETMSQRCSMNVANQTSDYVNSVLEKVVSGCIDGGLQT